MLQVSFRDLIPNENILCIAREGHSRLLARAEPLLSATCFSITIQRLACGMDEEPRFRVVLQLLHGAESLLTVKALASRAETALRNGLAVALGWVPPVASHSAHAQPSPPA